MKMIVVIMHAPYLCIYVSIYIYICLSIYLFSICLVCNIQAQATSTRTHVPKLQSLGLKTEAPRSCMALTLAVLTAGATASPVAAPESTKGDVASVCVFVSAVFFLSVRTCLLVVCWDFNFVG